MGHTSRSSVPTVPPTGGGRRRVRGVIGGIRRSTCVLSSRSARRSWSLHSPCPVVAPRAATPRPAAAPAASRSVTCKIGFFGALTGDAANLGINIKNGAELAVDAVQREATRTARSRSRSSTRQGDPDKAPALAQKAVDDKTVIGIVGPAFSGESKAADPIFNEAGLPRSPASATNPALSKNGWKTFHRILGNDADAGPGRREVHQGRPQGHEGRSSSTTRPSTARAWPTSSRPTSAPSVIGTDTTCQQKQTDFSADRHQGQGRRRPTRSSTVATTPRPASWSSSCKDGGCHGHLRRR